MLIICNDVERPDAFNLEIDWEDALEMMDGKEDLGALAKMLVIDEGDLVLVDPNGHFGEKEDENPLEFEDNIEEEKRED